MSENKVTKHDLYEKLWASRDFEINHLWQRSIFLATFIVALFTIYFSVLNNFTSSGTPFEDTVIEIKSKENLSTVSLLQNDEFTLIVKDNCDSESLEDKPFFQLIVLNIICLFGFLFSVLWICMAKGSKYMYERHEGGIETAHDKGYFDKELQREMDIEFYEVLWNSGDYTYLPRHGALPLSDYDYRIFHHNGAKYSSSKINIAIGYLFAFAWSLITLCNCFVLDCPFMDSDTSWFCKTIIFIISEICQIFIDVVLALLISYNILSDNRMSFRDFLNLVFATSHFPRWRKRKILSPDDNQIEWISGLYKEHVNKEYDYILTHVTDILEHYLGICDNPLQHSILDEFKGHETELSSIRKLLSNEQLKDIFETALMYRESFSNLFRYKWIDPIWSHNFVNISEEGKSIEFIMHGIYREFAVIDINQAGDIPTVETRLYADTDWQRIRAGFKDYDLINDARTMHLISKELNGSIAYMTLSFPNFIDKAFHYGKEPIAPDKFRRLHVRYIEISNAYDKPISFEMDFIRDAKHDSNN